MRAGSVVLLVLASACNPDDGGGNCWPIEGATPGGSVEMGTGELTFEPMPAMLPIITGSGQAAGPFLRIHARTQGLPPGDPQDPFNPDNPKTKIEVAIDGGLVLSTQCPGSLGMIAAPEAGFFDLVHSYPMPFDSQSDADASVGKHVHLTIDIVGSNGLIAHDERDATLVFGAPGGG